MKTFIQFTFLLLAFSFTGYAQSKPDIVAIRNAKIVTVTGAVIEKGSIIIRNGKITEVGATASIPSGAKIIDATGLSVYPGLIDAGTVLGLVEISAVNSTVDTNELGDFNANAKALTAVNPNSEHIGVARVNGVTTVLTSPQGGLISGQAALINLDGWTPQEMRLKAPVAMAMNYPSLPSGGGGFGGGFSFTPTEAMRQQRDKRIESLNKMIDDAKVYLKAKEASAADKSIPARPIDLGMEAMIPVIKGETPVLMNAHTEKDLKAVIEFANKHGLKLIINGGEEALKVAAQLKEKNIPVILPAVLNELSAEDDPYDAEYARAGELFKAGIKIAFKSGNDSPGSPGDIRLLPFHAGTAAAFGLPKEEALKAVTIYPAQIFGVDKLVGSIEVGKIANLIITDGDPLEPRTKLKYMLINGKQTDLANRHSRLYEKFKDR